MKNIYLEIRKLRKKLDDSVEKNGTESDITKKISLEMDALINEYYKNKKIREYPHTSDIITNYEKSYKKLKSITQEFNEFPSTKAWNKFAQENNFLSSTAMQYVSKLDWNKLRDKIKAEIHAKI